MRMREWRSAIHLRAARIATGHWDLPITDADRDPKRRRTVTCTSCRGSGRCSACNGQGKREIWDRE